MERRRCGTEKVKSNGDWRRREKVNVLSDTLLPSPIGLNEAGRVAVLPVSGFRRYLFLKLWLKKVTI